MLEKILVPLDGSDLGELALLHTKELATVFNSEIHLLSVVEKRDLEYRRMVELYLQKISEDTQNFIRNTNSEVAVKSFIVGGNPSIEIVEYSKKKRIDLVIMVSHGHSGIMPWTMGSTANKVIHIIECPVLLVRASMFSGIRRNSKLFSRILLPLDGSKAGESALPYVSAIAQKLGSEVILFSVVEHGQRVHTIGGQDFIHFSEQQIKTALKETNEYLLAMSKKFADQGINVRSVVRENDAAVEIIKYAKENNVRIVAMSSHGKSGMREWVFGSVSNKVLQAGKCPLLLVKAARTIAD